MAIENTESNFFNFDSLRRLHIEPIPEEMYEVLFYCSTGYSWWGLEDMANGNQHQNREVVSLKQIIALPGIRKRLKDDMQSS